MRRQGIAGVVVLIVVVILLLFIIIMPFVLLGGSLGGLLSKATGTGGVAAISDDCISPLLPKITDQAKFAAGIDQYISGLAKDSPFIGMGKDFVAAGVQYGINPTWIVNIARKESTLGTANSTAVKKANNAYGRTATADQPGVTDGNGRKWYKYDSFQQSIPVQAEYLKRRFIDQGLTTFETITPVYAPPSENDTAGYIREMKQWVAKAMSMAGDGVSCGSSSSTVQGPPGADQGSCKNVREIPKEIPVKNSRLAQTTLVSKLEELWKKNQTWRVTEACPPTSQHQDANHSNGRAVDIAISPPEAATEDKINQLQRDISSVGFDDVLDEYHTNTTFKTGGHFHLEWHGN